jgi:predicted amidohydrolase
MILPGYALMAQGTQIHVAAWPWSRALAEPHFGKRLLLSRAFALQGSCYVIAPSYPYEPEGFPEVFRHHIPAGIDEEGGGSRIIAPGGEVTASAPASEETILTAPASLKAVRECKGLLDVGGHYSRPDVLQLHINRRPLARLVDSGSADQPLHGVDRRAVRHDLADDRQQEAEDTA